MYPRRFSQSIMSAQHNLNVRSLLLERTQSGLFLKYSLMIRQKFNNSFIKGVNKKLQEFLRKGKFYKFIEQLPKTNKSNNVIKIWVHHCECVFAQRIRRCQQMVCLYSKWWEEQALKEFIQKMKQSLMKKGKITLGTIGIASYNWEHNRIPDDDMKKYVNELEYVYVLKENTVCLACESANKEDKSLVCTCGISKTKKNYDEWTPFIQQDDLLIWRRMHPSGLFEYKVYGSYNDVSAEDFLNVQVDTDYRRKWDVTAVMLEVAETDATPDSNSDIIYWEMQWPTLFANRDYVFNRRYLIDRDNNIIYITSRSTEHPSYPKYSEKYRIEDYFSCMVIKPYNDLNKPGLEFSLTYFDNPGVNVPSSVMTWVTMRAMPDFLTRLRDATRKYKQYCLSEGVSKACKIMKEEEKLKEEQRLRDKLDYCSFRTQEKAKLKDEPTPSIEQESEPQTSEQYDVQPGNFIRDIDNTESNSIPPSAAVQSKSSFWKYLQPYYYFQ